MSRNERQHQQDDSKTKIGNKSSDGGVEPHNVVIMH